MAFGKRHSIDWNDAGLRVCHATAVGELCMDGIGIGLDIVARAVGILKMAVASFVGYCMLNRGKVWRGGPQIFIIE